MEQLQAVLDFMNNRNVSSEVSGLKIYKKSFTEYEDVKLIMVKDKEGKWILASGKGSLYNDLAGEEVQNSAKLCHLSNENRLVLNRYFDYTIPKAFGTEVATMGLGDRLGLASPGHIEAVRDHKVKPVLAQQSIRELTLTGRSMNDIIDAASFAVFQEGYKEGFGADGDHLKAEEDIKMALSVGVSMLTLDCSDYIQNHIEQADDEEIRAEYEVLSQEVKTYYEENYLNKNFEVNGLSISYNKISLMKNVLVYGKAINYMLHIYREYVSIETRPIDFEISIDETATTTTPEQHFFVAQELKLNGVKVVSLAPRFCGEFQKGIDYIGDIEQFEKELKEHASIAEHFGYKLSIHSGSDKFKVFPIISKYTKGIVHVKTAGTNWLEAVRTIAKTKPDLYREMHAYAMEHLEEALQYYHITPNLDDIISLDQVEDKDLPKYMDNDAARQVLHVTYGILLTAKDEKDEFIFKTKFFEVMNQNEEVYKDALKEHIGNHLNLLNL